MTEIPMRSVSAYDHDSILGLNRTAHTARSAQDITSLNAPDAMRPSQPQTGTAQPVMPQTDRARSETAHTGRPQPGTAHTGQPQSGMPHTGTVRNTPGTQPSKTAQRIPDLSNQIRKGQKVLLDPANTAHRVRVCLGWDTDDPRCDIDVSAFILGEDGKVPGDDWFVFYGQEYSPDKSVRFSSTGGPDRQYISVDLARLDPRAKKIVFVLTINNAAENGLNFSMVRDAYVRILDDDDSRELVSFLMTDYYPNVISMMICEIYLHNGSWKCNAVGNGVARDLAGLCESYGVSVI